MSKPTAALTSDERTILEVYSRTHRGLVPDAIQAILASHDSLLAALETQQEINAGLYRDRNEAVRRQADAAYRRAWTHRDLVEGRCTAEEYVADLKADVDWRMGVGRARRDQRLREGMTLNWLDRVFARLR